MLELNTVFRDRGYRKDMGVKGAVAVLFNRRFIKSRKATTSNWANPRLTEAQLVYAANDAYAAVRVFHALGLGRGRASSRVLGLLGAAVEAIGHAVAVAVAMDARTALPVAGHQRPASIALDPAVRHPMRPRRSRIDGRRPRHSGLGARPSVPGAHSWPRRRSGTGSSRGGAAAG